MAVFCISKHENNMCEWGLGTSRLWSRFSWRGQTSAATNECAFVKVTARHTTLTLCMTLTSKKDKKEKKRKQVRPALATAVMDAVESPS